MSGGQRKRVTFADLVTARLPATSQPPGGQLPKSGVESAGVPTATEPAAPPSADIVPNLEETAANDRGSASGADLQLITPVRLPVEQPRDQTFPSQSPDDSQPLPDRQPPDDSQSLSDRQPLKEVKRYLRLPNTIVDSLLPTLDVYEQAVFVQLYRLSQGFGNYTCKVSLPTLQARTGVKATSLKQAISRLQARGIVEKISAEIGFGREQGITYWVSQDGRQTYGDWQAQGGSQPPHADNKR